MIEFRQKNFGILSDIVTGASIGGSVGGAVGGIKAGIEGIKFKKKDDKITDSHRERVKLDALKLSGYGILAGAALGALVGGIKELAQTINRKNTVDRRLMSKVVDVLKKDGFKEGINFTRDPKTATSLKTKICIVISRVSGELRISVNLVSDPKLKTISEEIIKRLPNIAAHTEEISDKFNDIIITSVSDASADVGLISGVIEKFIHSGYPVYLVEVG